jgi:ferredoxin-NADP reductase
VSLWLPPAASSVLAAVSTLHLALASLRNHRSPGTAPVSSTAVVSLLLAGLPWLFPSYAGLAAGICAHGLWFWVCERITPDKSVAPAANAAATARPATHARSASAPERLPTSTAPRPKGFVQTPVLAVIDETPDIRTFRFARPDGFEFVAGQFLTVRVRLDGRDVARCYSISSPPSARGYLDISVKRQGLVSNLLHSTLKPSVSVSLKAPAGAFVYPGDDDRPLLLLAGGVGITPLLSMLRHATDVDPSRPVTLLYAAHREDGLAFRDELAALSRRHPQVRTAFAVAHPPQSSSVYPGRIDEGLITAMMPDVRHSIAFICGPRPMIDAMREVLWSLGLSDDQVRFERFEAAVAASGAKAAEAHALEPPATEQHHMRCSRTGTNVPVAPGQTILEAAESGGVAIDSLCRAGVCGTCRTRVISGEVDCDTTTLDDADRRDGYVLACMARIASDCTVEL